LLAIGPEAVARARDLFSVGVAVESVGAAARCLEETVAYLKERVQFGRPIGSFQALKHRCADLATELEAARSTAYYAAWAVDGAPDELGVVAPLAEAVAGAALLHVAAEGIQMHGGIGFTWEHDAHMYLKRAKANELLAGGYRRVRRQVAERAGIFA
jgi:alkylation response protein AidB-like acyl-CoA dehydrogenase